MFKATHMIDKPVININTGQKIKKVKDVLYNYKSQKVEGFLVDEGGWFSDAEVIPTRQISRIGDDAVMIESDDAVKKADDLPDELSHIATDGDYLTRTKIVTKDGNELGKVTDLYFDLPDGQVTELEVSQGAVKDIGEGRVAISPQNIISIGEDATVVDSFVETDIDNRSKGGVAGAARDFSDKTRQTIDNQNLDSRAQQAKQDVKPTFQKAKAKTKNLVDDIKEAAGDAVDDIKAGVDDSARGKYLTKNVLTADGLLIGERGELITQDLLDLAKRYNLSKEIYTNSSKEPVDQVNLD